MKKLAIIVAGGKGIRMGYDTPKQFLDLCGKPIIVHTIERFSQIPSVEILITLPKEHFESWSSIQKQYFPNISISTIEGGKTRFHSVLNALNSIKEEIGLVGIHDGVRPLIDSQTIERCYNEASIKGSAVTSVSLKDSIRETVNGESLSRDRSNYKIIQTPQVFDLQRLKKAFKQGYSDTFTDDASVYEADGNTIHLVEGNYKNIKITTKEDLSFASSLLNNQE